MHLKSIRLNGFLGIPFDSDSALRIDDFGRRTILIGPNNAGKSILLRFLLLLRDTATDAKRHPTVPKPAHSRFGPSHFWNQQTAEPISAEIAFAHDRETWPLVAGIDLIHDGEMRLRAEVRLAGTDPSIQLTPLAFCNHKWKELYRTVGEPSRQNTEVLTPDGRYQSQKLTPEWEKAFRSRIEDAFGGMRFFDAVRSLTPTMDNVPDLRASTADDGSQLLKELRKWSQDPDPSRSRSWRQFSRKLKADINDLFTSCGIPAVDDFEVKTDPSRATGAGQGAPVLCFYFSGHRDMPVFVENMGTGVSQMVILLALLAQHPESDLTVLVEEPESNLHPALLRRFMELLTTYPRCQFIFTSHSNVILDALTENDRVYHFRQGADGICRCSPCTAVTEKHAVLDSLGVSGSTLLQTNCVIWVEGPSDRLYVREWIQQLDPTLVEGSDYAFAFYGGALLSHFALDYPEDDDFISMLSVCRYSAVLMDRDIPRSGGTESLFPRKQRILKQAADEEDHRWATLTDGWEIENDLGSPVLLKALAKLMRVEPGRLEGFTLAGECSYDDEVIAFLSLTGDAATKARKKITDKIQLAREVFRISEEYGVPFDPPTYMESLVAFILRSQGTHRTRSAKP